MCSSLELIGGVFASFGVIGELAPFTKTFVGVHLTYVLLAVAISCIFMSQSCRLLERSQRIGPLVLMAAHMLMDTLQFLCLLAGTLLGFACSTLGTATIADRKRSSINADAATVHHSVATPQLLVEGPLQLSRSCAATEFAVHALTQWYAAASIAGLFMLFKAAIVTVLEEDCHTGETISFIIKE
jgi:hypothetical protein